MAWHDISTEMFSLVYFDSVFLFVTFLCQLDDVTRLNMMWAVYTFLVHGLKAAMQGKMEQELYMKRISLYNIFYVYQLAMYSSICQPELFQLVVKQLALILLREQISKY